MPTNANINKRLPRHRFAFCVRSAVYKLVTLVGTLFTTLALAQDTGALPTPAAQEKASPPKVVVMNIRGAVSRNLLEKVRSNIALVQGDPVPAGLIVLIDSKGGDGGAAMKIGRLLRQANAHVFVSGDCASACVFILASGVVRGASAYSVGIHRGRVTVSDDNAKIIREVDVEKDPQAKKALERFESASSAYFAEMGLPPDFYQAMQAHRLKGVYRLTHEELIFYGLIGIEPRYLKERAAFYENLKGPYRMDKDELYRRTLRVGGQCGEFDKNTNDFVKCYKTVLKDPY